MSDTHITATISSVAHFYDNDKVGSEGTLGFRKSTDLRKFSECFQSLAKKDILSPDKTIFLDLGCADGRVNILASYFVKRSLGIEIDGDFIGEYKPRKAALLHALKAHDLSQPPDNIDLFEGDSLKESTFDRIQAATGIGLTDIDLFYTYITLHDLFGTMISEKGRTGSFYLVYGFSRVLPSYPKLRLVDPDVGSQGIAALYVKE